MPYTIRKATPNDSETLLLLIKELAHYEKLEDQVTGTLEQIQKTLFCEHPKVEAILLELDGAVAGFALFFHNYSTFLCKHGLYIEDLYVREAYRGRGYGKMLLQYLCQLAKERDCGRVEWWCLDWNQPSVDFYLKLGAEPMTDWTVYRLKQDTFETLAQNPTKQ